MANTIYQCNICKQFTTSITGLHHHQIESHTLEELSLTVLSLQGYIILNDPTSMQSTVESYKNDAEYQFISNFSQKPKACGITNTHEKMIKSVIHMEEISENIHTEENSNQTTNFNSKDIHKIDREADIQFYTWEHELNKGLEVNEEDFINSVLGLCKHLSEVKTKSKTKPKLKRDHLNKYSSYVKTITLCKKEQSNQNALFKISKFPDKYISQSSKMTDTLAIKENMTPFTPEGNTTIDNLNGQCDINTKGMKELLPLDEVNIKDHILAYDKSSSNFSYSPFVNVESTFAKDTSNIVADCKVSNRSNTF